MSRLCVRYSTDRYLQKKIKWSVNDMNMTASELREALLFDPETDSDLAVLEAACDIADANVQFAMEAYGDDYAMEADVGSKVEAVKQFLKTLAQKIANWVRGVINAIKAKFKKMADSVRAKMEARKAKARAKTIAKSSDKLAKTANTDTEVSVNSGEYVVISQLQSASVVKSTGDCAMFLNKLPTMTVEAMKQDMQRLIVDSTKDANKFKDRQKDEKAVVTYSQVQTALKNLMMVFNAVNAIAKNINATANSMKKEEDEKAIIIRTCCSRLANIQMKIARTLFSKTISVANRFAKDVNKEENKRARQGIRDIKKGVRDTMANV